jgi:sarcosine oxidase
VGPYDVAIVGLGGMGSAAAGELASRGLRVLGLEQHPPVHALGSSHGGSRAFRTAYFEDPAYVPLLLEARDAWLQLDQDAGGTVFVPSGCVVIGASDGAAIQGSVASAEVWDLDHELLDAAELRRRFPFEPLATELGMLETNGGIIRPEAAVRANLARAEQAGADLRFGHPVTGWTAGDGGDGVQVRTAGEMFEAGHLVLAPGAWAPRLLGSPFDRLDVQRRVQYWLRPAGHVDRFRPPDFPVFAWDLGSDGLFYGFPAEELDGVPAVKVAIHRGIDVPCDPDTIDREVSTAEVAHLRGLLRERIPALDQPALQTAVCMYTDTPDEHFALGPHPDHAQVTVAAGFSGHGFKFVPVIGRLVADHVTGRGEPIPTLFDPARLTVA